MNGYNGGILLLFPHGDFKRRHNSNSDKAVGRGSRTRQLAGGIDKGVIGCDYWGAYKKYMRLHENVQLQFCIAHLIRDVKYLATLSDKATKAYGKRSRHARNVASTYSSSFASRCCLIGEKDMRSADNERASCHPRLQDCLLHTFATFILVTFTAILSTYPSKLAFCDDVRSVPNIVLILVDDMGYGDPGCYNPDSKIPTPNIDSLARDGMRFTDAHAPGPLCHMSRYGLLTGRYPFRTNVSPWRNQPLITV